MAANLTKPNLNLLRNRIDLTKVPFSDRGSRLLIHQHPGKQRLYVKLAERLTIIEPNIEAYLKRPPYIRDLTFLDADGNPLDFEITSYPHILHFKTKIGEIGLVFQDRRTMSFGLPPGETAGLRFHVSPQFWRGTQTVCLFN